MNPRRTLGIEIAPRDVRFRGVKRTPHFDQAAAANDPERTFATSIGQEIRKRVEAIAGVTSCEVVLRDHFLREKIQTAINSRGRT